jgi:hypothetical protein
VESLHPACFAPCCNMGWFSNVQSAAKQSRLGRGLILLAAAALLGAETQLCRAGLNETEVGNSGATATPPRRRTADSLSRDSADSRRLQPDTFAVTYT